MIENTVGKEENVLYITMKLVSSLLFIFPVVFANIYSLHCFKMAAAPQREPKKLKKLQFV